jgi:diguanylate cyclase (GGDEF)-like protein
VSTTTESATAQSATAHTVLAWIAVAAIGVAVAALAAALRARRTAPRGQRARVGNRDAFADAIAVSTRDGNTVAVILINLDQSRSLIARLGHRGFDQFLVLVGARIQHQIAAAGGVAFRLRRDEFAVIVAADVAGPVGLAETLLSAVAEPTEVHIGRRQTTVTATACAGIAISAPYPDAARIALAHADRALRHAKTRGPGRVATIADAVRPDLTAGEPRSGPADGRRGPT